MSHDMQTLAFIVTVIVTIAIAQFNHEDDMEPGQAEDDSASSYRAYWGFDTFSVTFGRAQFSDSVLFQLRLGWIFIIWTNNVRAQEYLDLAPNCYWFRAPAMLDYSKGGK